MNRNTVVIQKSHHNQYPMLQRMKSYSKHYDDDLFIVYFMVVYMSSACPHFFEPQIVKLFEL